MTIQSWLIYLTLVFIATATPGPAVLFIVTNSTIYGWKKSSYAAIGNIIGLFFLGIIAVTGLGTILKASDVIFNLIKYIGALYLVYIGLKLFLKNIPDIVTEDEKTVLNEISSMKMCFQAFGVAISNPKAIMFLTALFPQFMNINEPLMPQFSSLIATLMFFSFFFLMSYSLIADKARTWIGTSCNRTPFNKISASIFIGLGLLLATSSNK